MKLLEVIGFWDKLLQRLEAFDFEGEKLEKFADENHTDVWLVAGPWRIHQSQRRGVSKAATSNTRVIFVNFLVELLSNQSRGIH